MPFVENETSFLLSADQKYTVDADIWEQRYCEMECVKRTIKRSEDPPYKRTRVCRLDLRQRHTIR